MNLDEIVARAAPPPERIDREFFEPASTEPDAMERRRRGLVRAFGSTEALAAHARALGLTPEAWIERFADVRLIGPDPDWARAFRAVFERLSDVPPEFAAMRAWARDSALAEWPDAVPLGPDALEGPLDHLASRLGVVLHPVRHVEQRLGGRTTWQARLGRSPALAFAIGRVVADWIDDLSTMAKRAAADRELLSKALFDGENPGALLRIEAGLGDSHAGGRSVAILHFDRGAVVYKSKDLRIAAIVGEIVGRLECAGMVGPSLLVRDGYAWERFHETAPLPAREDADAFFGALGGWLALLQVLGGYDFWFDNLIASGRTPRFIDFETAVQPSFDWAERFPLPGRRGSGRPVHRPAHRRGDSSVPVCNRRRTGADRYGLHDPARVARPAKLRYGRRWPCLLERKPVRPRACPVASRWTPPITSTPSRTDTSGLRMRLPTGDGRSRSSSPCGRCRTRRYGSSSSTPGLATEW